MPPLAHPSTAGIRDSRHGLFRTKENSFIQPDDAVDGLTNSFLFLLHKPHRSNKNHKKRKRSGTVPSPSRVNDFSFFTRPPPHHIWTSFQVL